MRRFLSALLALLLTVAPVHADTLFPNSPTTGQTYNFNGNGLTYQWDGAKWVSLATGSPAITKQVFTSSGTYTPSSGMQYAIIECVGSGGGGGGVLGSGAANNYATGGGGGGGSYSRSYVTAAQVGASQTVTVGNAGTGGSAGLNAGTAGNDVSVGTLCVGKGGGLGGASEQGVASGTGGAGGAAGTGDITVPGQAGMTGRGGVFATNQPIYWGQGGSSGLGFGAGGVQTDSTATTGTSGSLYGGGGNGGHTFGGSSASVAGGDGAKGIVIITEFLASSWGGPLPQVVMPGGRLTGTTAVPVTTSDVTSQTTLYYTPYKGSYIPLWNGTQFTPVFFSELSAAMGSNWAANSNYDWYVYNDAGTLRLCSGAVWTSDTARNESLTLKQGIYVNTASMTCRYSNSATVTVAAFYGTYVGTMRTTASTGTTEDSNAKRFIWNMYNRTARQMMVVDTTDTWSYATAAFRQANNSTANQIAFVRGLDEEAVNVDLTAFAATSAIDTAHDWRCAIGLDSATTPVTNGRRCKTLSHTMGHAYYSGYPGLGYHYLAWLEYGDGTATSFYGDDGGNMQSGIGGTVLQ